jgi:ketosteroid isomerase-like protein
MSQENVEIVRQEFHAFNSRDFDAMLANYAEDVEYRLIGRFADLMDPELRGRAAVRAFLTDWVENVGGRGKMETVLEVDDRVVVINHSEGASSTSGAPATVRWAQVYTFARGRSSPSTTTTTRTRLSKPSGCRSKTLTPTPNPAEYCAGDVAGERRKSPRFHRGL